MSTNSLRYKARSCLIDSLIDRSQAQIQIGMQKPI
ncbi:uncharacterized protein RCO7_14599 [Rhynchosporium graminicola]|uniref:Uncharacterized protein n=1 Tax=Rhynchosporium graminicola TaxID=2792576 RepID=A0A1E1KQR4_9HELO|nr:uncharacterized protein RCO7_14599 [Rhynchosporium commune]